MLEQELEFFEKNKQEYRKHYMDQFVLIHGEEFLGSYTTDQQAYEAGIAKLGNVPFLIKQVQPEDSEVRIPAYSFGLLSA